MNLSVLDVKVRLWLFPSLLYMEIAERKQTQLFKSARPKIALDYYEKFMNLLRDKYNLHVESGVFQPTWMLIL